MPVLVIFAFFSNKGTLQFNYFDLEYNTELGWWEKNSHTSVRNAENLNNEERRFFIFYKSIIIN